MILKVVRIICIFSLCSKVCQNLEILPRDLSQIFTIRDETGDFASKPRIVGIHLNGTYYKGIIIFEIESGWLKNSIMDYEIFEKKNLQKQIWYDYVVINNTDIHKNDQTASIPDDSCKNAQLYEETNIMNGFPMNSKAKNVSMFFRIDIPNVLKHKDGFVALRIYSESTNYTSKINIECFGLNEWKYLIIQYKCGSLSKNTTETIDELFAAYFHIHSYQISHVKAPRSWTTSQNNDSCYIQLRGSKDDINRVMNMIKANKAEKILKDE
uniref:Uncharacterized protein n=1 Tax=Acrobeloides nanus TaxID=290746 RepID=A0A914C7B3_9BILA